MAITAIRLQNFMAFGDDPDAAWIELKPITLLFGRNSSGKSAIIRALRLLMQSLSDAPAGSPFAYKTEDGVDVGFFSSMLHGQEIDKTEKRVLRFEFRKEVPSSSLMRLLSLEKIEQKDAQIEITLGFGWNEKRSNAELVLLVINAPSVLVGEKRRTILGADRLGYDKNSQDPSAWWFWSDFFPLEGKSYREADRWPAVFIDLQSSFLPVLDLTPEARRQGGSWGEEVTSVRDIIDGFRSELAEFLNRIEYARPMRPEPKRFYMLDDAQQRHWQEQGLRAFLKLIKTKPQDKKRSSEEHLSEAQLLELGAWLKKLELGVYLDPNVLFDISERGVVSELYLDEGNNGIRRVSYVDIGFGASQVIPVVIQSLLADKGSLVIIEQPELHLHPSAQAVLADLFIQRSREGVRFLIETHSEHILLRLQRRIAETTYELLQGKGQILGDKEKLRNEGNHLTPDDFVLIFVYRSDITSRIQAVLANNRGQLEDPSAKFQDFFKDDYDEVVSRNQAIGDIIRLEQENERRD